MRIDFRLNGTAQAIADRAVNKERTSLAMAVEWHRLYYPFIPFGDTEELASNVEYIYEDGKGKIHHKVPYAHKQYEGETHKFKKDKHPLATAKWDVAAENAGKKEALVRFTEKLIKGGG